MRRVAVTGLGAVSALGIGLPAFWDGVRSGSSGVRRITNFDATGLLATVAAEVPVYPAAHFDDGEVLEEWTHATARGATILAELAGYGATADAGHLTQPGT